ncbi:MAG TPA: sensor histidine kinase [Gemmatimonadaceae bacterium]|nr:sensor histidine kinase [Gemmatimonadaceae bacterium]
MSLDTARECPLAGVLAERMRGAREELTRRWLERIAARVSIDPNHVFPTDAILDHVPLLMDGIADYLEDPANEITSDVPVVAKAMELGELRHSQGFDAYEIMKEYEILGGILFSYLSRVVEAVPEPCEKGELLECGHRLFRAVAIIQQTTTNHYLRLANERLKEREERLRLFNRAMAHEFKNRIGTVLGAADVLLTPGAVPPEQMPRFHRMIAKSGRDMHNTLENLLALSRLETDARQQRHIGLRQAAAEVARQLREASDARGVEVRLAEDIPNVEVNAAAVELCLTNYVSNAVKYADPAKTSCWVEISGEVQGTPGKEGCRIIVRVRDNGLGVPPEAREQLFSRFFRAHAETITGVEGTGLGLSIVRETVEAIGGDAWAEFPDEGGSAFCFSLPCRRGQDK